MVESLLKYIICFYTFVSCQYNFNLHFELHFPNLSNYICPEYHVYVLGLFPHTCVSYHNQCFGVTKVEVKKYMEEQLLCHPNYQINFSSSAKLHKNFYVDPEKTISLSIDSGSQFIYTQDIYLPNCFIMYTWYTSTNQKSQHCLYYNGAYSLGNKPFADFSWEETLSNLYAYGSYDEFSAIQCPNKYCDGCTYSPDLTSFNCTSCIGDRFINANKRDCSLVCPITGGLCNEQNPIPTACRSGFKKIMIDANTFRCDACQDENCLNCDDDLAPCSQCKVRLWSNDYFSIASIINSYNTCYDLDNCIEYQPVPQNSSAYIQKCQQPVIGYMIKDPINIISCQSLTNLTNCYHCTNSTSCLVCNVGYYLKNSVCVQQAPCSPACKTCLADNANYCTSCYLEKEIIDGVCVCEEVCLTCSTYHECLSCKVEQFRYLDGTRCVCFNGYYDGGDASFLCYKCHPTCLTCEGESASNCVTCNQEQNRHLVKGECICNQGFGEIDLLYSDLVCQKCYQRCKTCAIANDPLSCTSCQTQQLRKLATNSNCQCVENYGDDGDTKDVCYRCHFSCGSCDGGLATDCTTCESTSYRQLTNKACLCQKGYYENEIQQAICSRCHYSCFDCSANSSSDQCTQCPPSRKPDGIGATFSCLCKDSHYFDDGVSSQCQQCHYSCVTCTYFGSSFCQSCDLTKRQFSNQNCLCLQKTYDDGISTCLPCHSICLTCNGNQATDCQSCYVDVHKRQLKGGQCICQDGYLEDNGQLICLKCSYRCKTCSITKDQCLSCVDNSYRDLSSDSSCQCPQGFFDVDGNGVCQICHQKCEGCLGPEENQCADCKPQSNRYFSNNRCLCLPHYYEQDVEQCSDCSSLCYECENTYDNCTSCQGDRVLIGNTCQCGTKLLGALITTYVISGSNQCQKCHYSCLTCNGTTNNKCIDCYAIENRYLSGSKCLCNEGFFDAGVQQCQKCGYQCSSCIYSQNQCLSCQQNSLRTLVVQSFACSCQKGYYDDGQNPICQQCHYSCQQCSIHYDRCLSCFMDSYRQFNEQLFACTCESGYYDNGDAICKSCHYSCYECTGQTNQQCKSCKISNPLLKRRLLGSKCICEIGYYDDGFSTNCQPCAIQCEECENQPYHCIACSTSRKYSNFTCECLDGYYEIGQKECNKCDQNCLQCKTTASNCIACDSTTFKVLNQQTKSCICQSNYLAINGDCQQCNGCQTCQLTINNCSSCEPNRQVFNGRCICQDGYFENQNICQNCHKSCLTCQDNERYCLTCSLLNNRKLSINNTCDCFEGYFDQLITSSCEKCDNSCKTCSLNYLNCTSCETILNLDIFENKCMCKLGYYLDSISITCLQCHISCLSCVQYQICSSCLGNTRNFDSDLNTCNCQLGYFEANQADCLKCDYSCNTCKNSQDNCLSCHPLANRKLQGNKCECLPGFFDAGIDICISCEGTCKACKDRATDCTLCYELEQQRVLVGKVCNCQSGYFENGSGICQKCSIRCKTCAGSAEYCTSCDINQRRLDHSIIHKCPCMQGFYDDESYICQKCHIKCEGCLNTKENCLSCRSSVNSNRYFLADQCNCKPGYYDDNIQFECQKCNQRCKTCVENESNCLVCYDNLRISPPTCKCLDGYYENQLQFCTKCSSKCLTCEKNESNCLSCQIGRINQTCDCWPGYFDTGFENCLKCEFQCLECTQSQTNCISCRGDRIQKPYCICADGYYDNGVDDNCQACDYRCSKCNVEECLACNGNRILSVENSCDPPINSVSYDLTPWCSNCEVAVLIIRFSDDLNSILIKFDFQLKQIQQAKRCSDILYDDTLSKLGFGYSCDIDEIDFTILKISLGQEPSVVVGDQIQLKPNVLSHTDCQKKLMIFIFDKVLEPLNYLQPIIQFKMPNYQINSCTENNIFSNFTQNDGRRRFAFINWSYKIADQESISALDVLIQSQNLQQEIDLIIPAQTLPENSEITFSVEVKNFLNTQSIASFTLYTQLDSQPLIQVDVKSSYYNYQDINIVFSIEILNCRGKKITQSSLFQIDLLEIDRSISSALSSNVNYSINSNNSSHSVKIPKYSLTPGAIYYFNLSASIANSLISSYILFSFEIKMAQIICEFRNAITIWDCRKDLNLYIQCKDLNVNTNWNDDAGMQIEINCNDLFTQEACLNRKNEKIEILPNAFSQKVPKNSMKPYSVQSWQVIATKGNLTKAISHIIVFLDDDFLPLSMKYDTAYSFRPINNYELLNFTYDIPQENKQNVVEMSAEIISDFVVLSLVSPNYYEYLFKFQEQIGSQPITNTNYNFRFSVQYSTNINPSFFNLPINLNIPPICQKLKQFQSSYLSLTQLEVKPICSISDDSPYQYKFGYFLSETDLQAHLIGDKKLIIGETAYQQSPKLIQLVPSSFLNNSIKFLVSVMDQGGSITNIYGQTEIDDFNCTLINNQSSISLKPDLLLSQYIKAFGSDGQDCDQLKHSILQKLYSRIDFSSQGLNILLKALSISKKYQSISKPDQRRVLDDLSYQQCYDEETDSFRINYTINENFDSKTLLQKIEVEIKNFDDALLFLIPYHQQLKVLLESQTFEQDQKLNEQYDQILTCLQQLYLLPDNIILELSKIPIVDEKIYKNYIILYNLISKLSEVIQESVQINGNPLNMVGEIITWELIRSTKEVLLGLSSDLQAQIKFSQKEQFKIKLNPLKYSNQTMENIKKQINFTEIIVDPETMIQTRMKNFLFNDKEIELEKIEGAYQVNLKLVSICASQSPQKQEISYRNICVLLQKNGRISQCSINIIQQEKGALINCKCQEFGQIFLAYYQDLDKNTNDNTQGQEDFSDGFQIFNMNIEPAILYQFFAYIGAVGCITILFIVLEIKQQRSEGAVLGDLQSDTTKLNIKCYPGNYQIITENFKFLHQLTQFCYNNQSMIKKSYYFIDVNTQFCFMLLIAFLLDFDFQKQFEASGIIFVLFFGIFYRFISKILQGFVRINNILKTVIYILLVIILISECLILSIKINNQSSQMIEKKILNWSFAIVIYEILIEPMLIVCNVYTYKLTFKSINFKEFKILYHLFYYFAYQEKLEQVFQQFMIL